jgi:hypothetical protein
LLSNLDYTLAKYAELCQAISHSRYKTLTLADYLESGNSGPARTIIMRHDVDRNPKRAAGTAEVEQRYGIQATYYFRQQKGTYVPDILDRISRMGHEIGYHYETMDKCKGDRKAAMALFEKELNDFRTRYKVRTVCAHGNPLTSNDNKDIWKDSSLSRVGLLGEAFLSLDFTRFAYFSDSGRTWMKTNSQKMPGKDSVSTSFDDVKARSTDDVIKAVKEGSLPNICILTHPERWSAGMVGFAGRFLLDLAFSWGKGGIYAYRRMRNDEITVHN